MATIKSYTDLSQSKILSKILSDKSADMVYLYWIKGDSQRGTEEGIDTIPTIREGLPMEKCDIPCWSLAALLEALPYPTLYQQRDGAWGLDVLVEQVKPYSVKNAIYEIDACYEMIIKLNELNLL